MGDIRAGLEELKLDGALFANVKYYVSGESDPKIVNLLQEGGAESSNYFSDYVTHLIAGYEALENDISAAKDLYEIPAVTQNWILYSVKCNKLLPTQYFSPEENQLFSNIRACISQVSRTDSKSLWAMITLQGGKCQLRLDRYCTHLITGKANGVKYETAMRHHIHIVTPDWITECCKKGAIINEMEYHPRLLVYPSPNSSTAMITGFMDEDPDNSTTQEEQDRTKAMLEQLKQRMPWNQPSPPVSSNITHNLGAINTASVPYLTTGQNTINIQSQQQHLSRPISTTSLNTTTIVSAVSDQNVIGQTTGWLPQVSQQNNISQMKAIPSQMQQQELSTQQQQINIQHQLIQHQQLTSQQQQLTQQQITQHQQQLQQQSYNQQQLLNQQASPQVPSQQQQLIGQPQTLGQQSMIAQQQISSQLSQHQLTSQQQQLLTSQQKQLNQHQIIQQQQMNQQQLTQPHLAQQQQQVQLAAQQQQQQQIVLQQQQQQLSSQPQQIAGQHQLAQPGPPQLTSEQRQLILLQQQQQQQKIQQISQQLQQSAPQSSQQFVIREGQLQQQQSQSIIGPNQQGFIVQRDSQWQQQQYLQLQRQQQQIGPQRPGGQWPALRTIREDQQPPQQPRQLIQLDAQTHQQLQQMDPLQRAQFIQKIQKQKNLILQRQMQNRQAQQGPHIAVIRSPGKPVQPSSLQWVQQARPQMMGPQIAQTPGQKPVHPGIQPPALTPINPSNQVIVPAGQNVQGPQAGQTFQQGQPLTPQQILHMQKQQMARLQFQHLQQQQQQGTQQEPPLTSLSSNAQIAPDQQLVVNAKTKTALANMLTNRLQGGTTEGSAAGQLRLMTAQHRAPPPPSQDPQLLAAYQRRTAGNITNGAPSGIPMKMQYGPVMQQPKAQFYGHNPNLKLPPDLFLLGCIFVIVEYDVQRPNEVSIWKQVIERHGGEVEPQYCSRATHVLAITQKHPVVLQALREDKRCVSAHWLSDVVSKLQLVPPWHALHFPIPFTMSELPCVKQIVSLSGFEGEERAKVKYMLEALGAKYTNYFSRHNTLLVCRRPDGQKYKKAREWQTSVVNAQWLTDILCGQTNILHQIEGPKYQQFSLSNPFRLDYSLVPHLMGAWKHPININQESYDKVQQVGQGPNSIRKYKRPRLDGALLNKDPHLLGLDEPIVVSNPDPPPPDKQPRILFSGINPRKHAKRIRELGGALAASWRDATHLVMSTPLRTVKLLCCLSRCKFIVTLQWLLDCSARNTFLDENVYMLGDPEFEKNFNCNIQKALASPNRGTVLKGKIFYVTPSVIPSPSAIAEIIESAGGAMDKTRKSLAQIQEMNTGKLNYIIVTHENDLHLLSDVLRANISVFSAEIVLGAVARQYFQLDGSQV
ncbi:PAX-interacting protein 1 [Harpegnathos saltator]|uniref:PAX-interacting protein 1 n=1 Tax=Harpegnathos saltator TaxID=610380 RepID=E2BRL1_HARSA|nr:PAX-interacting protein 1 [Harpegnathos saltator]EFN81703.1 PAX-interacting protein 1 [Harpegnathos saltator]